ncbi:MAG: hypothetical protein O7A06_12885, partial [Acidobacteria bacterium]|nr:hypothetical protein [Acidobacteriota bacterium]
NGPFHNLRIVQEKGFVIGILRNVRREGEQQQTGDENVRRRLRPGGGIAVWSVTDEGNVPPIWVLRYPGDSIGGMRLALNPKWKEVIVGGGLTVRSYSFPEIF